MLVPMSNRTNRILAIVVGVIILVAVAAAVYSANRPTSEFDAGTPEGTAQAYLQAVLDRDYDGAAELIEPDSGCLAEDLQRDPRSDSARIVLLDSSVDGDRARVVVEVVDVSGSGPFDTSEYTQEQTLNLVRSGQGWLLTDTPWPLYSCTEGDLP
ncbi:hypothetical protein BH24ACT8_BH24ACT8_19340 [soil metagenome]|jgi:hypothetical protein